MLSSSSLLFAGKQYPSQGKRAVERSMWLRVVRLITLARCSSAKGGPEGGAGTGKTAWAEKTVSKRSFDTGPCLVEIPRTSHTRNRRITKISGVVHGLQKIKTILDKRPSPAEKEFRMSVQMSF